MDRQELKYLAKKELLKSLTEDRLPELKKLLTALKEGSVPIDYESHDTSLADDYYEARSKKRRVRDEDLEEARRHKKHHDDEDLEEGVFDFRKTDDYDEYGAPQDTKDADMDINGSPLRHSKHDTDGLWEAPVDWVPKPSDYEEARRHKKHHDEEELEESDNEETEDDYIEQLKKILDKLEKHQKLEEVKRHKKHEDDDLEEARRHKKHYADDDLEEARRHKKHYADDDLEESRRHKKHEDDDDSFEEAKRRRPHHDDEDLEEYRRSRKSKDDKKKVNDIEELDEGWYQNLRGYFNKDSKYRLPYSEYEDDYETRCHNDPRCRELKRKAVRNSDLEEGNDLMQALDKHPPVYAPGIREEKDSDELDEDLLPKNVKPG